MSNFITKEKTVPFSDSLIGQDTVVMYLIVANATALQVCAPVPPSEAQIHKIDFIKKYESVYVAVSEKGNTYYVLPEHVLCKVKEEYERIEFDANLIGRDGILLTTRSGRDVGAHYYSELTSIQTILPIRGYMLGVDGHIACWMTWTVEGRGANVGEHNLVMYRLKT